MRTQWTTKGNRDADSSCLCDRGLHRYLQNFGGGGGGLNTPNPPSVRHCTSLTTSLRDVKFSQRYRWISKPSGMSRCVDGPVVPDASKGRIAFGTSETTRPTTLALVLVLHHFLFREAWQCKPEPFISDVLCCVPHVTATDTTRTRNKCVASSKYPRTNQPLSNQVSTGWHKNSDSNPHHPLSSCVTEDTTLAPLDSVQFWPLFVHLIVQKQ